MRFNPYSNGRSAALAWSIFLQILVFPYAFWIVEYRRVQSWKYALGICLGMRPRNLFAAMRLPWLPAWSLRVIYCGVTLAGLSRRFPSSIRFARVCMLSPRISCTSPDLPRYGRRDLVIVGNRGGSNIGESFARSCPVLGTSFEQIESRFAFEGASLLRRARWHLLGRTPLRLERFSDELVDACVERRPRLLLSVGIAPVNRGALDKIAALVVSGPSTLPMILGAARRRLNGFFPRFPPTILRSPPVAPIWTI